MSIKTELDEVRKLWANAGVGLRTFLVLQVFLSIKPIAELSQVVFNWKGFILDGLHFHHEWIERPFAAVLALLHIDLTRSRADIFILLILGFVATCRLFAVNTDWKDKWDKYSTLGLLLVPFATLIVFLYVANDNAAPSAWALFAISFLGFLLGPVLLRFEHKRAFYLPIAAALIVVGLLAAINVGLTK